MNTDQKTYELINSYLSGELKGRKLDAFKARLKKEEDLRNKLELQQAIIDGIKISLKRKKNKVQSLRQDFQLLLQLE